MRRMHWIGLAGLSLVVLSLGCKKSSPQTGDATTDADPAVDKQADYDSSHLAAELKSTSPTRRVNAIQLAVELDGQGEDVIPTLLNALKDPTAGPLGRTSSRPDSAREAAVLALLELKGKGKKALQESGLKTLEHGLKDKKANVREHTANAIGMIGPDAKQSAPALEKLCADREKEVRAAAYRSLEKIKNVPPQAILRLLVDQDTAIAMEAANALTWLKPTGPDTMQPLLDALKRQPKPKEEPSDIAYIRNAAAEALGNMGKGAASAVPALVELLKKTDMDALQEMRDWPRPGERGPSLSGPVLALRRIGKPAVPAVVPLLKSDQAIVRYQAAAVLSGMRPGDAASALPQIQAAMDAERGLTTGEMQTFEELVAATLNQGGDAEKIVAGIMELLKSDDKYVRFRSVRLLVRIGRKAAPAVPKLIELLDDEFAPTQSAAIAALSAIGPAAKSAVIELAKKVEGGKGDIGREAARALKDFGPAAAPAAPALAKALNSNDSGFCVDAANALAAIGPEALPAIDAIAKHLADPNSRYDEQIALLRAAAAIGPPAKGAVPAVAKLVGADEIAIRLAAVDTLGKIGSGNADALAQMVKLLKDHRNTPFVLQTAILRALAGMGPGGKSAAGDVKAYLQTTKEPQFKVWASATLVAMGSDADIHAKAVLAALKDKSRTAKAARIAAIESTEFLGPKARPGVHDLIEALKDKSSLGRGEKGTVRERAAHTLGRLGTTGRDAIGPLIEMLRDSDRSARRAAAEALGLVRPRCGGGSAKTQGTGANRFAIGWRGQRGPRSNRTAEEDGIGVQHRRPCLRCGLAVLETTARCFSTLAITMEFPLCVRASPYSLWFCCRYLAAQPARSPLSPTSMANRSARTPTALPRRWSSSASRCPPTFRRTSRLQSPPATQRRFKSFSTPEL